MSKPQPKISAKEYRAYVEGKGGIAALNPPSKGKGKPEPKSKRAGKYNAKGCHVDRKTGEMQPAKTGDTLFMASQAQAVRYRQLKVMEKLGVIERLRIEVPFILTFNGVHICTYRADAEYVVVGPRAADAYCVIEDVKGMRTDVFDLKEKLMSANGTAITVIPAKEIEQWDMRVPPPS